MIRPLQALLPLLFVPLSTALPAADRSAPPAAKQVTFGSEPVPVATLARAFQEQTGTAIDVSALATGIYFVRLATDDARAIRPLSIAR